MQANEFAKSLYHKGDIMYDKLKALFGTEDVINISSEGPMPGPKNNSLAPIIIHDSEDKAESPISAGTKLHCQKHLFITDNETNSCRALVSLESNFTKAPMVEKLKEKKSVLSLKSLGPEITIKKESSSCASSSPSKWIYSPMGKK